MENLPPSESPIQPDVGRNGIDPLNAIRLLRSAGGALCSQAGLYGQLAKVEWAEEKIRLTKMLLATLAGFIFLLCVLLFLGVLILALSWDTAYRIHSVLGVIAVYAIGMGFAWHKLQGLSALGGQSFAATREEMAADLALIRSKL